MLIFLFYYVNLPKGELLVNLCVSTLIDWGRETRIHVCVGNLTIIGSDNCLSPGRRHAIIWLRSFSYLGARLWNNIVKDFPFLCEIDYNGFREFVAQWGGPDLDDGFNYVWIRHSFIRIVILAYFKSCIIYLVLWILQITFYSAKLFLFALFKYRVDYFISWCIIIMLCSFCLYILLHVLFCTVYILHLCVVY